MSPEVAYRGVTVDHLYPDCPALVRPVRLRDEGRSEYVGVGEPCVGMVDPEGTDLCFACQTRWRAKRGQV